MKEYLLDLLVNVDKCDVTSRELRNIIRQNGTFILNMKNRTKKSSFKSAKTLKQNGGDNIEIIESHLRERDNRQDKMNQIFDKFEHNKEKREETIQIAGLMAEFVGELSNMIKSKPEYGELQKQIEEIQNILKSYV